MTIEWWMLKYEKIFTSGLKKCVDTILTTRKSYSNDKYQSFSILRLQIRVIKEFAHKDGRSRRGLKKSGSVKCVLDCWDCKCICATGGALAMWATFIYV